VLVLLASANRDDAACGDADRFDPWRAAPCLTFGNGRHACPGQGLAVRMAAAIVDAWLEQGLDPETDCARWRYLLSLNARLPFFIATARP
jgi:cytochrome P450